MLRSDTVNDSLLCLFIHKNKNQTYFDEHDESSVEDICNINHRSFKD